VFGGLLNVVDAPIVRWFDFGQGTALHRWLHPVLEGRGGDGGEHEHAGLRAAPGAADPDRDRDRRWPVCCSPGSS
jgi:hypothetical protein